jgi:hypothetical protein
MNTISGTDKTYLDPSSPQKKSWARYLPRSADKLGLEDLGPILRVLDSFNIGIEQISLVRQLLVVAFQCTSQNNLDTGTFLVTVGKTTNTGSTTWTKINNVGQIRNIQRLFPNNRSRTDQVDEFVGQIGRLAKVGA